MQPAFSGKLPRRSFGRWVAGELHFVKHGTYVTVEGDIDGNGKADFQIDVHNLAAHLTNLAKGDFVL